MHSHSNTTTISVTAALCALAAFAVSPQFDATDVTPTPNNPAGVPMGLTFGPFALEGVDPATWVAMGTGGLTNLHGRVGSYAFLAIADPKTRKGYVAGWLTDEWASGSVHYGPEGLTFKAEYGRLKTGPDTTLQRDTFVLGRFDDCRLGLEAYADEVVRRHGIDLPPQIAGFCTWYSDKGGFVAKPIRKERGACSETMTREFVAKVSELGLRRWGLDYYQIDDTWQDGVKQPGPAKVFCRVDPEGPYPNGMKKTADGYINTDAITFINYKDDMTPLDFGVYDSETQKTIHLSFRNKKNTPATDEKYHWYKIGKYTLGRKSFVWGFYWMTKCDLQNCYRMDDDMGDINTYTIYVSAKFTGPAYVPNSEKKNEIYWDQVMLVREK